MTAVPSPYGEPSDPHLPLSANGAGPNFIKNTLPWSRRVLAATPGARAWPPAKWATTRQIPKKCFSWLRLQICNKCGSPDWARKLKNRDTKLPWTLPIMEPQVIRGQMNLCVRPRKEVRADPPVLRRPQDLNLQLYPVKVEIKILLRRYNINICNVTQFGIISISREKKIHITYYYTHIPQIKKDQYYLPTNYYYYYYYTLLFYLICTT